MEKFKKWEVDNLYSKPLKLDKNSSATPESCYNNILTKDIGSQALQDPLYDVLNPTPDSEIYDEPNDQRPKAVLPPVKPNRIQDPTGLNREFDDDYLEEKNPLYEQVGRAKRIPPPTLPKPQIHPKPQTAPRKLDLQQFSNINQVVNNVGINRSVRSPSQRGGAHIAMPEGYAVPHDVLHLPMHISAGAIYDEPVDALQGSKPRKVSSSSKTPSDSRSSSGKKKNPPTTPMSPLGTGNRDFIVELQKSLSKGNKEDLPVNSESVKRSVADEDSSNQIIEEKEPAKRKKELKKKIRKQKEDQDKEKKKEKKRKSRGKKPVKPLSQQPQIQRPPIEECVTGDETVPPFVIKCVEFLEKEGISQEGIYRIPGKGADSDLIMSTFGKNPDMNLLDMHMSVPAVCTALKQFFSKLPEPLIPYNLQKEFLENCTDTQNQEEQTNAINILLEKMPRIKKETLKYMMLHLNKVMMNFLRNKMTSQNLAICWLITLMHTNCETFQEMQKIPRLTPILERLISEPDVFYPSSVPSAETGISTCNDETDYPNGSESNVTMDTGVMLETEHTSYKEDECVAEVTTQ